MVVNKNVTRALVLALLLFHVHTRAWNGAGHFVVAAIAYDQLTPSTKMRVDAILSPEHPDFPKWTMNVPAEQKGKVAFVKASGWPGDIKSDPRFFDPGDPPTPEIPGLPPSTTVL